MKYIITSLSLIVLFSLNQAFGFQHQPVDKVENKPAFQFRYDLSKPFKTYPLPDILEEISGLSFTHDYKQLLAVQDELGILFYINKETGNIEKEKKFWKEGDYEGIEVTGPDEVWVVKSTATIYEVKNLEADFPAINKYKSDLNKDNDVEGLGYDRKNNLLLMACKGDGFGNDRKKNRMICGFDLSSREVKKDPVIKITLENIRAYLKSEQADQLDKFDDFFDEDEDELPFAPSGIAIHPKTDNIYILSSKKDLILVLSPQSEVLYMDKLKKKIHPQAEGICFDEDGTLYISNEAKKGDPARIYVFNSMY